MSSNYAAPSQRGAVNGGSVDTPGIPPVHSQSSKMHMSLSSADGYPTSTVMSSTPDPRAIGAIQPSLLDDQPTKPLPKIGETRCYWALLSAGLDFIYLDPVLQNHLETQASLLVGKSLLDFVHPDERSSAEHDLGSVLESKTLHGSVTRVRYCRLSRIRHDLGHRTSLSPWEDADKIALDSSYMAVDIVINWAADGLVLCFIHAVTDLTPNDNDEHHKSPWTNWCGTPFMSMQQIELLYQRLLVCIPQAENPSRVFQILSNHDERSLMMTWPPDQGQGRDYAKLVEAVNIKSGDTSGDDAKTSCTRRYKALQNLALGEVESIIVPHGTIVFACHKVTTSRHSPTADMQELGNNTNGYISPKQNQQYIDQAGHGFPAPAPYPTSAPPYGGNYHSQAGPPYPPQQWPEGSDPVSAGLLPQNGMRSASYPPQQQQWGTQPYMDPSQAFPRAGTPEYGYNANGSGSPSAASDTVPPPRRRVSPSIPGTTRETHGGRSSGNRPIGIQKCTSCKTTSSPEWRKGPSGKKELCNACGLRYARSRAKKEGTTLASHRKRKDKGLAVTTKRGSAPPSPLNGPSSSSRRSGYDGESLSGGSASGSEVYSQPAAMDVSPSPSPPASSTSFVHYAHPNGAHQRHSQTLSSDTHSPYPSNTNSFYSAPSPLSNPNVQQSSPHGNHNSSQMSAIRMDSSYPRVSSSSASTSPLTSTIAPASYERGGEKSRELPTPVSPESRLSSARSMLMLQQ